MSLSSPALVQQRLEELDGALARAIAPIPVNEQKDIAQNAMEAAALAWFRCKRDREVAKKTAYAEAIGTATERKIIADAAAAAVGVDEEALWEARKLVVRVLESRANVGMAILKAQGRS